MKNGIFNRQSVLELSLLAIFTVGLIGAKLIVDYKSRITLGPGIQLLGSGLTVYLPQDQGWRGLREWQYEQDNTFVLPARLIGRSGPVLDVSWKYRLASSAAGSRQVLEKLALEAHGELINVQSTTGSLPMEYGRISGQQQYIGAVLLDFGRVLTLQVRGQDFDFTFTREVFLTLAQSFNYKKSDELTQGVELLQKARTFGMDLFSSAGPDNYLIRDAAGRIRGYQKTQMRMDSDPGLQINRTTFLAGESVGQRIHRFESAKPFDWFNWQSQNKSNSALPGTFSLILAQDRSLTMESTAGYKKTMQPGPAVVAEILLEWVVRCFLETEQQKMVIDVLYFDGSIIPAQISSISPAEATGRTLQMAFAVRVESPAGSMMEFYFGPDKNVLGKITRESPRRILLWDPVSADEIEKQFNASPAPKGPMAENAVGTKAITSV